MTATNQKMSICDSKSWGDTPERWNVVFHHIGNLPKKWFDPKQWQWNQCALDILDHSIGIRVLKWDKGVPCQPVEVEIIDEVKFSEAYYAYIRETTPPFKGNL